MKQLKGKKLLILAGAAVHCKVVEAAKKAGVYTIVTDNLESSPAKKIADEKWMISIMDVDAIVEMCVQRKVDGILNLCIDPAQRSYQQICEKLKFPCYGTAEQVYIMTDKTTFKKFCEKNGIDIITTYTIENVQNGNCEYPLIVKPTDSRGSRGQAVCYTKKDTLEAIAVAKKESSDVGVVIEKYLKGKQDFSMTYFVCDGKSYLIRTCDRYLGRIEDNLNKQCICCVAPSKYSDWYLEKVHEQVVQFIQNLGIKNGPVFMQGFIDGDTLRVYDPGLRFPGGEYEKLLMEITGVDLITPLIEFSLTGQMTLPKGIHHRLYELNGQHTIQLPITVRPGKIVVFDGMEDICKNGNVVTAFKRYEIGEEVPATGDVRQRVCEVAMVIPEGDSVQENIEWVKSRLNILDENYENMVTSFVDTSMLKY